MGFPTAQSQRPHWPSMPWTSLPLHLTLSTSPQPSWHPQLMNQSQLVSIHAHVNKTFKRRRYQGATNSSSPLYLLLLHTPNLPTTPSLVTSVQTPNPKPQALNPSSVLRTSPHLHPPHLNYVRRDQPLHRWDVSPTLRWTP
jgi:hypothetical protein